MGLFPDTFSLQVCESASPVLRAPQPGERSAPANLREQEEVPGYFSLFRFLWQQRKHFFQVDGYDLDLTYVTTNIIAMSFPSKGE